MIVCYTMTGELRENFRPAGGITRRNVLATMGVGLMAGLAGCGGGDGGGSGGGGTPDKEALKQTATEMQEQQAQDGGGGGGSGIKSVEVANGSLIVTKTKESNVASVQLYKPNDDPIAARPYGFNKVSQEAEIDLPGGLSPGEYTLLALTAGGEEVERQTLTLQEQFEVLDAQFKNPRHSRPFIRFKVRNTGGIPLKMQKIEIVESSGTGNFTRQQASFSGIPDVAKPADEFSNKLNPGVTKWFRADGDLTFTSDNGGQPCADWQVESTYTLTSKNGNAVTVDVTIDLGSEVKKLEQPNDPVYCKSGKVVDFSGGTTN